MSLKIFLKLKKICKKVDYCDPFVPKITSQKHEYTRIPLDYELFKDYDCILILTDHTMFNFSVIQKGTKLIFDTRGVYQNIKSDKIGLL